MFPKWMKSDYQEETNEYFQHVTEIHSIFGIHIENTEIHYEI